MELDPFAQQILEKAEKRSRALGISNVGQVLPSEYKADVAYPTSKRNQEQLYQLKPNKETGNNGQQGSCTASNINICQYSSNDKENMDIEIKLTVEKDCEVRVEVEEHDMDGDNHVNHGVVVVSNENDKTNAVKLRDTSRSRLQRLGALYSDTEGLSSPIHRTEEKFCAESKDSTDSLETASRSRPRLGKLAALANTINQWENETAQAAQSSSRPLSSSTSLKSDSKEKQTDSKTNSNLNIESDKHTETKASTSSSSGENSKKVVSTKRLNWDPQVMTSLEAQGFQRRESSTVKYSYDYNRERETSGKDSQSSSKANVEEVHQKLLPEKPVVKKSGLVSNRAALFEQKIEDRRNEADRFQKDPTELSLKERRKLFEVNKGEPPIPKAPLGQAPPISKLWQSNRDSKKDDNQATQAVLKPLKGVNFGNKGTISENTIISEAQKQRKAELEMLTKRFDQQKELFKEKTQSEKPSQSAAPNHSNQIKAKVDALNAAINSSKTPPPPPPPPPQMQQTAMNVAKRRSPPMPTDEDESKRARKNTEKDRLYPALSDLESNDGLSDSDRVCATTTVSVKSPSIASSEEAEKEGSYLRSVADNDEHRYERENTRYNQQNDMSHPTKAWNNYQETPTTEDNTYSTSNADTSTEANSSMGVDDLLDEVLDDEEMTNDSYGEEYVNETSRDSKGTITSNSFSFRKTNATPNHDIIVEENSTDDENPQNNQKQVACHPQPVKSELKINEENDNMVTLVHTVSFYRRQQNASSANATPIRKVCHDIRKQEDFNTAHKQLQFESPAPQNLNENDVLYEEEDEDKQSERDESYGVEEKIKKLLDEVCKQQQIIAQTSQALNLCAATVEFSGSTESVEGERHLLVATHRRQACLDEVQRLRVEKSIRPLAAPKEKGRLTVKEITIPLRQDYIRKLSANTITGHHLVCLLKYNEHVLSTKTVPTLPGLLAVKFPDVLLLDNVYADFRITLEIYGMTAQREVLPHEVKYHINLNKKCGIKTPKKKGSDNRLVMPPVQSPAGPNVVRTPALVQYGFAIFSLREIQRTSWTLTQVLGVSPLDGTIHMKVNCELSVSVEHKGFLTMFEDISGFGAWHRRWCFLNGTMLNYWKYPDDEKKKAPMGTIDLYTCISQKVAVVPRDICARLNTILLECQRPYKDSDEESLIIIPNGRTTIVRHLLSADTKEEREEWCAYFNKALTLLRAWGPPQ